MSGIDQEWENFISTKYNNALSESSEDEDEDYDNAETKSIETSSHSEECSYANIKMDVHNLNPEAPKSSEIYISTKTKIAYLNQPINLKDTFWKIQVMPYATPSHGVVKKQMKFNSITIDELDFIQEKLQKETYFEEYVITNINNPNGRIKFKDIRKVSVGVSKKDLMSYRCKKKSAFYNCFVLILRIKIDEMFKEFHVKVFNTGKLEIPGVQKESSFQMILDQVIATLQPHIEDKLDYKENSNETVLINSNFNCGFFINRELLHEILRLKYNIQTIYDPCSYPGIQSKFYYNHDIGIQNGCQISEENKELHKNISEVSFMIFRTGSVLIVGKCDESVLYIIYEFLKKILVTEYTRICQKNVNNNGNEDVKLNDKKKKIRRKTILVNIEKDKNEL